MSAPSSAAGRRSAGLTETGKAIAFSGLVLTLALVAGLLITLLALRAFPAFLVWGSTTVLAVLIMMFVVTRDGFTREGWRSLGLHRLGLHVWWIAFGVTLLTSVLATAAVWAIGLASFAAPDDLGGTALDFVINVVVITVTFAVAEEIAWRGYLLPRLLPLGRNRALAITGLVHAAWHLPLILLTRSTTRTAIWLRRRQTKPTAA